jgi:hypothetical protein
MDDTVQDRVPPDTLAKVYLKIKNEREKLKAEFENQDSILENQLSLVKEKILSMCKSMNADSIKTPFGTIIRSVKSRYWTSDWDSMYTFIEENGAFGLLEKRLHQTNMKNFLQENPDLYPKGMNVENEFTVLVRKPKEN